MQGVLAFALMGLLALSVPLASARGLKQASSGITDADILNFALNLEVRIICSCFASCLDTEQLQLARSARSAQHSTLHVSVYVFLSHHT